MNENDSDYIKLFDGNSTDKAFLMADLLGRGYTPSDVHSVSHQLTLRFFTDFAGTGAGFKAKIMIQDRPGNEAVNACSVEHPCHVNQGHCFFDGQCIEDLRCGIENCPTGYGTDFNCCYDYCSQWLNMTLKTLTSPNYPNYYENMLSCSWIIASNVENILIIEFEDFGVRATYLKPIERPTI